MTVETDGVAVQIVPSGHIARVLWMADFEPEERRLIAQCLKPGMTVVNIGANVGLYTVMASRLVGKSGAVYAFEPSTKNFGRLRANVRINACHNVTLNNCAIAAEHGELILLADPAHPDLDSHYSAGSSRVSGAVVERVRSVILDEYWATEIAPQRQKVDWLIIDVEGAECNVLLGARKLLAANDDLMVFFECTENAAQIEAYLGSLGYRIYLWNDASDRGSPVKLGRGNFLACKKAPNLQV